MLLNLVNKTPKSLLPLLIFLNTPLYSITPKLKLGELKKLRLITRGFYEEMWKVLLSCKNYDSKNYGFCISLTDII